VALALPACITQRSLTDTKRSATEQILVAGAIERAVAALAWPDLSGRRVAVEAAGLAGVDSDYLAAAAAAHARGLGARVVARDDAEWVIALRGATLGTSSRRRSYGIPAIPLLVGETPAVHLVQTLRQRGWARVALEAVDPAGARVAAAPTVLEQTSVRMTRVLFVTLRRYDLPAPADGAFELD
jgi:hypothetical protein